MPFFWKMWKDRMLAYPTLPRGMVFILRGILDPPLHPVTIAVHIRHNIYLCSWNFLAKHLAELHLLNNLIATRQL